MRKIVDGVYVIEGLRTAHVFVLPDSAGLTVIDSGTPGELEKITEQITAAGYAVSDVHTIILTHAHSDHVGSLAGLAERTGAQVVAHQAEVAYVEQTQALPYPTWWQRLLFRLGDLVFRTAPCRVDQPVQDGEVLDALGGLQVIHTPGHTPGSIALYQPERQILFCGDIFFHNNPRKGLVVSPLMVSVDVAQARAAAAKLAALPVTTLCVSHGAMVTERAGEKMQAALQR